MKIIEETHEQKTISLVSLNRGELFFYEGKFYVRGSNSSVAPYAKIPVTCLDQSAPVVYYQLDYSAQVVHYPDAALYPGSPA